MLKKLLVGAGVAYLTPRFTNRRRASPMSRGLTGRRGLRF